MILTAHRRSAVDEWVGVGVPKEAPRLPNKPPHPVPCRVVDVLSQRGVCL